MRIKPLINKLSLERIEKFTHSPVWRIANQKNCMWEEAIVDEEIIQEAVHLLSPYAAEVLKEMLRLFAAAPVEGEQLVKEVRKRTDLSGAECQLGLAELEEAGVLFSVRKAWGERLYFLPLECFSSWQRVLFPIHAHPISQQQREVLMNADIRTYCRPFGRQLLAALATLGRSGLKLTVSGTLPKKTVNKLLQSIDFDERCLGAFHLKWSYPESYPLAVAFILEASFDAGLLEQAEGILKWNVDKLSSWLMLEEAEREQQLLSWLLALLLPASGGSAHLAAALCGLDAGKWYAEQHINHLLHSSHVLVSHKEELDADQSLRRWYGLWHSLGWLEVADCCSSDREQLFFRWKITAPVKVEIEHKNINTSPYAVIQPNGEIIVEPGCPFWIRWELELLAQKKSDEQISVYRLEAAAIAEALEQGRTKSGMRDFLVLVSGGEPLHASVEALLEVWTSRACRVGFAEVTLLHCADEAMAAVVETNLSLAPFLLQKLGNLDFIVQKSQVNEIRNMLRETGYSPRKAIQSSDESEGTSYPIIAFENADGKIQPERMSPGEKNRAAPVYIYESFPLHHFELSENPIKESLPTSAQRERVPAMWIKQLRAYHHSTRRELIEQALQWQTTVQLQMEHELRSFIPERLEQQSDGWAVIGILRNEPHRQSIRLTPDMWEEMRLVIPGQDASI